MAILNCRLWLFNMLIVFVSVKLRLHGPLSRTIFCYKLMWLRCIRSMIVLGPSSSRIPASQSVSD